MNIYKPSITFYIAWTNQNSISNSQNLKEITVFDHFVTYETPKFSTLDLSYNYCDNTLLHACMDLYMNIR